MGKTTEGGVVIPLHCEFIIEDGPTDDREILIVAFEEWLNHIAPADYPSEPDREMMLHAFIAGATRAGADFNIVTAAQGIGYPPEN